MWQSRSIGRPNACTSIHTDNFSSLLTLDKSATQEATKNCDSMNLSDGSISSRARNGSDALLKHKGSLYLATFNVGTLNPTGQKAVLARILETFKVDACYASETPIQWPAFESSRLNPNTTFSRFNLDASGDRISKARGPTGTGIPVSVQVERSVLDWIPVNSRLNMVRFNGSVCISRLNEVIVKSK